MQRRELQCHMQRHPNSHQTTVAKDMSPKQPSVLGLLGSTDEEILEVAKDVYCGWYQVALSILPHWFQDQLMGDLHNELGQWLWKAGLHDTTS